MTHSFPTRRSSGLHKTYQSKRYDVAVEPAIVEGIKRLGAANGMSFVNTLLVAFEVFLNRTTNQTDIIIGLPTAGQLATGNLNLVRSEEHTSELQSLMRISYAVFCLKKKKKT